MTMQDLTLISLGFIFQGLTFGLGILVGASLRRKDMP
jgi:hypothetical protein